MVIDPTFDIFDNVSWCQILLEIKPESLYGSSAESGVESSSPEVSNSIVHWAKIQNKPYVVGQTR